MTKRLSRDTEDVVNRYVLILDTETTGLPRDKYAKSTNYTKWDNARLVQIAWEFYNPSKECIIRESYIIKPDNFEIPQVVVNIHGISTERAQNEGISIHEVFNKLYKLLQHNPVLVAHNMQFDSDIILAELYRYQNINHDNANLHNANHQNIINDSITMWNNCIKHCTMLMGTHPGKKWPKLVNLYEECFGYIPPYELHRAENDVRICADIYFYLLVKEINGPES
jgi:DNA polymerase III epsilon subunit-like protein